MHIHLQILTSSASSKTKTNKEFFRRRKRTKNFRAFFSGHEEELKLSLSATKIAIKTTGSRTVRLHVSFVKVAENSF